VRFQLPPYLLKQEMQEGLQLAEASFRDKVVPKWQELGASPILTTPPNQSMIKAPQKITVHLQFQA